MIWPPNDELLALAGECKTKLEMVDRLGCKRGTLDNHLRNEKIFDAVSERIQKQRVEITEKVEIKGDEATITTQPQLGDMKTLLTDRGLDPEDWEVTSAVVNEWGENRQLKVHLQRRKLLQLVTPVVHVPAVKKRKVKVSKGPKVTIVETDAHAPYHDRELNSAKLKLIEDLRPAELVDLGDGMDFPTISRHADHPAAVASPQECASAYYHEILRPRSELVPGPKRVLRGNHCWRLESELLARAERMYGLKDPDGADLLSMENLLHLDRIGWELVRDPRGWEFDEVTLIPNRLVARHGFVTGNNTAAKTLAKLGVSALVGHDHTAAHYFKTSYPSGDLHQLVVVPASCRLDETFPHYATNPNWTRGCSIVTSWPDGYFNIEHAIWQQGSLFYRDRRYDPDPDPS